MSRPRTRRDFLHTSAAGGAAAFAAQFGFLAKLPKVCAQDARLKPDLARFDDSIEPLVRLIEDTPRNQLLERVAAKIQSGTSYQEVLAALLLAGVRNVQPHPSVGFKFHAVLVVNSCHLASLHGPDEDRWLPIFWALDYFKSAQADEVQRSGWRMPPIDDAKVPDANISRDWFVEAMDRWDADRADLATAGLVRTAGATEVFHLFAQYAARDFRSIGHKAIFLANAWRTLEVIGWQYAEPVLRSLASALVNSEGDPNPADHDLPADRPWRDNARHLARFPASWLDGPPDDSVPRELCAVFRTEGPEEAAEAATDVIAKGISPQSVWDSVFVGAGELLMRQPAIVPLHNLTTANALYYIWLRTADDELRKRLLLQACSFNTMFRGAAQRRGAMSDLTVDDLQPASPFGTGLEALDDIFRTLSRNRGEAAAKVRTYLAEGGSPHAFVDAARRLLFQKGSNTHDYKFASAVLEDYAHVSPAWRDQYMALSVFNLRGADDPDNQLVRRTQAALS